MAWTTDAQSIGFGSNIASAKVADVFNTTVFKSDKDAKIMRWLSLLEPQHRHDGVRTKRFGGIRDWLLGTSEFREWRRGEGGANKAVLFCSGDPGVGKTFLT